MKLEKAEKAKASSPRFTDNSTVRHLLTGNTYTLVKYGEFTSIINQSGSMTEWPKAQFDITFEPVMAKTTIR
jgi:hypothetical protein